MMRNGQFFKTYIVIDVILIMAGLLSAGSWSTSGYASGVGCTNVIIPAGARNVQFRMTIDDTPDDDNYDLYVYFPTRTDCSVYDCMPNRGYERTEICGPYNPYDYKPSSVCGGPAETWRFKIEENGWCYGGWNLYVTWTDCNVGNDCSTPNVVNLPADMTYRDAHQWTTGRGNVCNSSCLGAYDDGEDVIYKLVADRAMTINITLDPRTTPGTAFVLDTECPPTGSCIAQSTNASASPHSVTGISISAGTYYLVVDYNPSITSSIPDFDLWVRSSVSCTNPITINIPADVPYTATQQYTCGRTNNYFNTCLRVWLFEWLYYDTGEDMMYVLNVTAQDTLDIIINTGGLLTGTPGAGFLLASSCPPPGPDGCLYTSTNAMMGEQGIYNVVLTPGTYYLMVDTDSSSSKCIPSYTLNIKPPTAGPDCANPYIVNIPPLPYSHLVQSTSNKGNEYSSTCLGNYDNGLDVIYKITVSADVIVDIELDPIPGAYFPPNGTGMVIHSTCPAPSSGCLASSTDDWDDTHRIIGLPLYASVGTYYLMLDCYPNFVFNSYYYNLRITENTTPANPPAPRVSDNLCGAKTLTRVGTPPPGVIWYWQGTSCGTRTDLGSGETFIATASGTYYIRAYNTTYGTWSAGCGSAVVTVNPYLPVSVSISASPDDSICAGTNVIFTATPTNPGASPAYQWKKNGFNVGTSSPTYTDGSLANGDIITCILTSSEPCATGNPATSNVITMVVYNNEGPGIWTGYANTNWNDARNWGQCTVPSATINAVIPSSVASGRFPTINTIDGTCVCKNITINGTLNGGTGNLFVYGEWLNNGNFNCGTGTITFIGTGTPAIGGSVNTTFYYIKTSNTMTPIDLRRNAVGEEIDSTTPSNEGIDLRGTEEIDLR